MLKLIETVPNFSCSKEHGESAFTALINTANSIPGCILCNTHTDGNHNRSVFTLIGSPGAIEEVSFELAKTAMDVIDLNKHMGGHPRMGAVDVMPFIPISGTDLNECAELSKRVAKRIWDELQIPSFLYEASATSPERKNLADIRRGGFEKMPDKLLLPGWAPDFGERKVHPTAGIIAIGARKPLIAFNVNLATADVSTAKKIAKTIRASSGGLRSVKALGIMLGDRNIAQVSMNMIDYEDTSIPVVYELIKALAKRYGTYVTGSELVGMTPAKALLDCAEFYLGLENFDTENQVIEYKLIDME